MWICSWRAGQNGPGVFFWGDIFCVFISGGNNGKKWSVSPRSVCRPVFAKKKKKKMYYIFRLKNFAKAIVGWVSRVSLRRVLGTSRWTCTQICSCRAGRNVLRLEWYFLFLRPAENLSKIVCFAGFHFTLLSRFAYMHVTLSSLEVQAKYERSPIKSTETRDAS